MSTDGERIAAALRRSPLYVDPAYAGALPKADRDRIAKRIRRSPTPIYVVLVPIVTGGTWQSSKQLATVVQSHLNRDGSYVTLDADFGDVFDVLTWGGTDGQQRSAYDAGWTVSLEKKYKNSSLAARLGRCVDLIATGKGTEAYEKAQDDVFGSQPTPRPTPTPGHAAHDDGFPVAVPVVAAAVLAAGGGLLWLRRRRARVAVERLRLPRAVFGAARQADVDELRARAESDLLALGESLNGSEGLDAYSAASRAFDRARSAADLAGVLVLAHLGRAGKDAPPLCYFDPRHGEGPIVVNWRAPGTRTRRTVRVCSACAKAVRDRTAPEVLLDDGRPYYEGSTPWAETGYGQFGDLVGRILDE